jgi:secondary thiamine-phosphate synthase enzyme
MKMLKKITISTSRRNELVDISSEVRKAVSESGVGSGLCIVFCPHTTAAITINENADPDVDHDLVSIYKKLVPDDPNYHHAEGNSDSHAKSSMIGASETIIIDNGKLVLGTWQGIRFLETDGPRSRTIYIKIIADSNNQGVKP